jgi:galactokinase
VTENARTLDAAAALRDGRLEEMGRLMLASHASLSTIRSELPRTRRARRNRHVARGRTLGARMTGGGFGGCTVNLVRRDALENFRETIDARIHARPASRPTSTCPRRAQEQEK